MIRPGSIVHSPVGSPDFLPTIAEMAGLPAGHEEIDGVSLVPLLRDERGLAERALFWHYPHYGNQGGAPSGAVREGDWKLIEWYEDGRSELFDLRDDIGEANDLSSKRPELAVALAAKLADWRRQLGAAMPAPNPIHDPAKPGGRAAPKPRTPQ